MAAEDLQDPDENFQRIGVKIKHRGEFHSNGLLMPNQYLRRDSDSFPPEPEDTKASLTDV